MVCTATVEYHGVKAIVKQISITERLRCRLKTSMFDIKKIRLLGRELATVLFSVITFMHFSLKKYILF